MIYHRKCIDNIVNINLVNVGLWNTSSLGIPAKVSAAASSKVCKKTCVKEGQFVLYFAE